MVAAEAASAGRPILLTDRCGVAELLGPDGALVVRYDLAAVRTGLDRLLADPVLRGQLGARAREVSEAWSWGRVVDLQKSVYEEVLWASNAT